MDFSDLEHIDPDCLDPPSPPPLPECDVIINRWRYDVETRKCVSYASAIDCELSQNSFTTKDECLMKCIYV